MLDGIKKRFHLVIIDSPPRQSAATANALCAATHVLVPTVPDMAITPTTLDSLESILNLRKSLILNYNFLGIVPSMIGQVNYLKREKEALADLKEKIAKRFVSIMKPGSSQKERIEVWEGQYVLNRVALRHEPGQDLAYFRNRADILNMFVSLGSHIMDRIEEDRGKFEYEPARSPVPPKPEAPIVNAQEDLQTEITQAPEELKVAS